VADIMPAFLPYTGLGTQRDSWYSFLRPRAILGRTVSVLFDGTKTARDDPRPSTSQTDVASTILAHPQGGWSVGMTSSVSIDWKAGSDDMLTFPARFGRGHVIRIGKMPMKTKFKTQYSLTQESPRM